jgi:hypothetical protein
MPLMEDATPNKVTDNLCVQCGYASDAGSIFCSKCGRAIRRPTPLTKSTDEDFSYSRVLSPTLRFVVTAVKGIAGIAAVVFILCPLGTGTQLLAFVASIVVLLICHATLSNLDDGYIDHHLKDGYWPKPLDWGPRPTSEDAGEKHTERQEH